MGDKKLWEILNAVDNSHEPKPLINNRSCFMGLDITFMVVAYICVCIRLYTRFFIIYSPGIDDVFVVISLVVITVGMIALAMSPDAGMGQHILTLTGTQRVEYFKLFYVATGSYTLSTATIKISLLLQYLRIYERGSRYYTLCRILLVVISLWGFSYSLLAWVPCAPVSKFWNRAYNPFVEMDGACWAFGSEYVSPFIASWESHAALNSLFDLLVMAAPLPLYFDKDAPGNTRRAIYGIVGMGCVINLFSIWRFVATVEHKAVTYPTFDPTWYAAMPVSMGALEVASACICASIPVFWGPILRHAAELLGFIFVTHEVQVNRETTFQDTNYRRMTLTGADDAAAGMLPRPGTGDDMSIKEDLEMTAGTRQVSHSSSETPLKSPETVVLAAGEGVGVRWNGQKDKDVWI